MGYIFDINDAVAYQEWFDNPKNKAGIELENRLMLNMLEPIPRERVLDIGCGMGSSLLPFYEKGLLITGLDPSGHMLDIAAKHLGHRADLHSGFAENLPFDDNSFDYAILVKTLEFVEDPSQAIEEACRVAKNAVFVGVLNRHSLRGTRLRAQRIFADTVYKHAHFFSIWELKQMIHDIVGDIPVSWRTVCQFSTAGGKITSWIECSDLIQRCPFGAFTGMTITLIPRFRTRPLELRTHTNRVCIVRGMARIKTEIKKNGSIPL